MSEKKKEYQENGGGWGSFLVGSALSSLFGSIHGMLESWQLRTRAWTQKLVRHLGLLFFSMLGIIFCLVGSARLLDGFYGKPGLGEVVVGGSILSVAILLYILDRNDTDTN